MTTSKCTDIKKFTAILKKNSLKATPQRLAVHHAMMDLGHASADMVADHIQGCCDAKITVATVYNILSQMADIGIYERRMSDNSKMYFDVNTSTHMHIYDEENHTYKDIKDDKLTEMIEQYLKNKKFRGYSIQGVDIQILAKPTKSCRTKAK